MVSAVAGRRILYLACGGHYTLAVAEHDPRAARWSRESLDLDLSISNAVSAAAGLIAGSGPSKMLLSAGSTGASGVSLGGPGSDRGAAGVQGSRGAAPGTGGLVLSGSYNSLSSSSAPSSSRGESGGLAGGSGSGGGTASSLIRRSERRIETRHSDKGFLMSKSSRGSALTRSVDRSCPGGSGGGSGGLATQSLGLALGSGEMRGVSFAPTPATVIGGVRSSDHGVSGAFGSGGSPDPHMMSLQTLAKASKKSRLAIANSFKGAASGMVRNDSNASSASSRQGWGDSSSHKAQQGQLQLAGRSSFRQVSYSSYSQRSDQDLMTVSTNSSLSSITPSASGHSLHDSMGGDGGEGAMSPGASVGEDFQRQLRWAWQKLGALLAVLVPI